MGCVYAAAWGGRCQTPSNTPQHLDLINVAVKPVVWSAFAMSLESVLM